MVKGRKKKNTLGLKVCLFVVIFVVAAVFFLWKDMKKETKTVWQEGSMLRIGDTQVDYREGMIYLNAVQEDYEQYYGNGIWDYVIDSEGTTLGSQIKADVLEQIIYIKVVCQKADELGIVLTEEELQQVEEQTKGYMEKIQNSILLRQGVNMDIVRRIYADNLLARKTFEVTTLNVDTDIPDEEAAQHRFQAIAIRNFRIDSSGNKVTYEGVELEELIARVDTLWQQAKTTEDFYTLAYANTEDSSMLEFTGGEGDFPESYENTIMSLRVGEVSEIIETEDYYYIFYCVSEFDVDATYEKKEEIISMRQEEDFQKKFEEWKQVIRIEINEEVWEKLEFGN